MGEKGGTLSTHGRGETYDFRFEIPGEKQETFKRIPRPVGRQSSKERARFQRKNAALSSAGKSRVRGKKAHVPCRLKKSRGGASSALTQVGV